MYIYIYIYIYIYDLITFRVGDNLNIKVADFGLARDVHIKEYYRQQSKGKIPVRWMAPEALHNKINNEKSDVVSYCYLNITTGIERCIINSCNCLYAV